MLQLVQARVDSCLGRGNGLVRVLPLLLRDRLEAQPLLLQPRVQSRPDLAKSSLQCHLGLGYAVVCVQPLLPQSGLQSHSGLAQSGLHALLLHLKGSQKGLLSVSQLLGRFHPQMLNSFRNSPAAGLGFPGQRRHCSLRLRNHPLPHRLHLLPQPLHRLRNRRGCMLIHLLNEGAVPLCLPSHLLHLLAPLCGLLRAMGADFLLEGRQLCGLLCGCGCCVLLQGGQ